MSNNSKHVIFAQDTKKKKVDTESQTVVDLYDKKTVVSYTYAFNRTKKVYDILTTTIDLSTMESSTEILHTRFDSEPRAVMEIRKLVADDVIKKGRK